MEMRDVGEPKYKLPPPHELQTPDPARVPAELQVGSKI